MSYKDLLLIDDDEDDQEIFFTALQQANTGASYSAISDATEALRKLTEKEISPDVIFLDLNMPVMSGQQFLVEIKKIQELKSIPVIIFSTSSHAGTIQLTKELGAHDFITKPDKFDNLVAILKGLLTGN